MNNDPYGLIIFGVYFALTLIFWRLYLKGYGVKLFEKNWKKTKEEIDC